MWWVDIKQLNLIGAYYKHVYDIYFPAATIQLLCSNCIINFREWSYMLARLLSSNTLFLIMPHDITLHVTELKVG